MTRPALSFFVVMALLLPIAPVSIGDAPGGLAISNSSVSTYIIVFDDTPYASAMTAQSASDLVASCGGQVKYRYNVINGMAVTLPDSMAEKIRSLPNVKYVEKDQPVHILLDAAVPQIGADQAWAEGYTGEGVKVAVIDTGVDAGHPDLNGGKVVAWADFVNGSNSTPYDDNGHGTHVSSIIAGTGNASGGKYLGVAPNASLLAAKALDGSGSGYYTNIIKGMDWAVQNGAQVISMSLGGNHSPAMDEAVSNAVNKGVVVVVAAGNGGPSPGTISCPGDSPDAITVGAVDKSDLIANFSSRGPTYDGRIKPDVTNVGVNVTAANAGGTAATGYYISMSGTSMATPMTAGVVALMLQKNSSLTPAQVKNILAQTAKPMKVNETDPIPNNDYGWGRVQAKYALDNVTYSVSGYSSSYLSDTINGTMIPGDYNVTITMLNNGTQPWSRATNVTLHSIGDAANLSAQIIQLPDNVIIPPGQQYVWLFNINATTLGEYNLTYQMYVNNTPIGDTVIHPMRVKDAIQPGNMTFVNSSYEAFKSSSLINLTVQRVDGFDNGITVKCSASGGNGTAGIDFSPASGLVVFAQDQPYANFTVNIYNNGTYTGDKSVNFTLSDPTGGAGLGALQTTTVTIIDDNPRPVLQFNASNYIAWENQSNCQVTVTRTANSHGPVSVDYMVWGGNATPGVDYVPANGTLNFSDGQTAKGFNVIILNNYTGRDRFVNLTLSNPTNGSILGTPASAVLTIKGVETVNFTYSLVKGWNLISVPLSLSNNSIDAFFPAAVKSNLTDMWYYDNGKWVYYSGTRGYSPKYAHLVNVTPGKGYWVKVSNNVSFTVNGIANGSGLPAVGGGWTMIGVYGLNPSNATTAYPGNKDLWYYDNGQWYYYSGTRGYSPKYPHLEVLEPGKGYWVHY